MSVTQKLVNTVLQDVDVTIKADAEDETKADKTVEEPEKPAPVRDIAEMDKRVGELERIIGSSNTVLDEVHFNVLVYARELICFSDVSTTTTVAAHANTAQYPTYCPHSASPHRQHFPSPKASSLRP